jgi:hypothetical protein
VTVAEERSRLIPKQQQQDKARMLRIYRKEFLQGEYGKLHADAEKKAMQDEKKNNVPAKQRRQNADARNAGLEQQIRLVAEARWKVELSQTADTRTPSPVLTVVVSMPSPLMYRGREDDEDASLSPGYGRGLMTDGDAVDARSWMSTPSPITPHRRPVLQTLPERPTPSPEPPGILPYFGVDTCSLRKQEDGEEGREGVAQQQDTTPSPPWVTYRVEADMPSKFVTEDQWDRQTGVVNFFMKQNQLRLQDLQWCCRLMEPQVGVVDDVPLYFPWHRYYNASPIQRRIDDLLYEWTGCDDTSNEGYRLARRMSGIFHGCEVYA